MKSGISIRDKSPSMKVEDRETRRCRIRQRTREMTYRPKTTFFDQTRHHRRRQSAPLNPQDPEAPPPLDQAKETQTMEERNSHPQIRIPPLRKKEVAEAVFPKDRRHAETSRTAIVRTPRTTVRGEALIEETALILPFSEEVTNTATAMYVRTRRRQTQSRHPCLPRAF